MRFSWGIPLLLFCLWSQGCTQRAPEPKKDLTGAVITPVPATPAESVADQSDRPPAEVLAPNKVQAPPTAELKTDVVTDSKAESSVSASQDTLTKVEPEVKQPQPQSVSTLRLAILAPGGPKLVKLDVHVGGRELAQGSEEAAQQVAKELGVDFTSGSAWKELLDKPLVASGWLGNLVPTAEQREQLINLYDTDKNGRIESTEFRAFLTRGLSRGVPLRLTTGADVPPLTPGESLWGPMDENQDGQLSAMEIEQSADSLMKYDFDADRILTVGELRTSSDTDQGMMAGPARGMMDYKPVTGWDVTKPESLARSLMEFYTYSDGINRELFDHWDDARFQLVDKNKDEQLGREELKGINDEVLHVASVVGFPDATGAGVSAFNVDATIVPVLPKAMAAGEPENWSLRDAGARIEMDQCILTINLRDDYATESKSRFIELLERAASDPQLQGFLQTSLDLKGAAFDLVRSEKQPVVPAEAADSGNSDGGRQDAPKDGDQAMTATAALPTNESLTTRAWGWVVGPRQYQVQVSWTISRSPWFELLDTNGDSRLVSGELAQFSKTAKRLDKDQDGFLSREEMPISVVLTVARSDPRGAASRLGGTVAEKRGTNASSAPTWFTGMDYNSDGELSQSEFLGDQSDFEKFDRNRDGVIEAREINAP